jgi:hypothetical protein
MDGSALMKKLLVVTAATALLACWFIDEAFAQRGSGFRGGGGIRGAAIGGGYRGAAFRGYGYRGVRLGWGGPRYVGGWGRYGYRRGWGYYGGGFAAGAILGGLIAAPYYYSGPYYYPYEPAGVPAYRYGYQGYTYAPGLTQYDRSDPSSYYVADY